MSAIDDPAAATAAGICLTARALDANTARHPGACAWCDYPRPVLSRMVRGFLEAAERGGEHDVAARAFRGLSRDEQIARVASAQGVETEPGSPADGDVPWL